nr:aminodeoxychorismate synthase component I [Jannaschia marina]
MARVLFDRGPRPGGTLFEAPRAVIRADTAEEVEGAFARMEAARAEDLWLAGAASYELGAALLPKLAGPRRAEVPLLQFGVFDRPSAPPAAAGDGDLTTPEPLWTFATYKTAFERVQAYIAAGDIYQANLTFPLSARWSGDLLGLHARLAARQPVPHGALVDLGGPALLSRSPELFFRVAGDGTLEARPMKGTARRGADAPADAAQRRWLTTSEKNRAENLMIVDLLRNDMARVSDVGSVAVPELFAVETYATLHQMTSRITSRLRGGTGLSDLFTALFPCGSVTGAPKIRAMQIIEELEAGPRGAYCGAVGWIAPNGAMEFGVSIRTLTCHADGRAELSVGGGIVHDSTARDEYDEALLKARFALLDTARA